MNSAIILLSLVSLSLGAAQNVYYYNHRPIPVQAPLAPRAPTVISPMGPRAPPVYTPTAYQHLTYHPVAPIAYASAPVAYAHAPVAYAQAQPVVGHAYLPRYAHGYPAVPVARHQPVAPEYQTIQEYQPMQVQYQPAHENQALQQNVQAPVPQQEPTYQNIAPAPVPAPVAVQPQPQPQPQSQQLQQPQSQQLQQPQSQQLQHQPEPNNNYRNTYAAPQAAPSAQQASQQQDSQTFARASGREVKYTIRNPQDPNGRMQVVEMQIQSDRQMTPAEAEKMMNSVMGSMGMRSAESAAAPQPSNTSPQQSQSEPSQERKTDVRQNFNSFLRQIGFGGGF